MEEISEVTQSSLEDAIVDGQVFVTVLDRAGEGIVLVDTQGQVLFANEAARRLYAVPGSEISPDTGTAEVHLLTMEGAPFPPEERPLTQALARGETVRDVFWRIQSPDGSEMIAQGTATLLTAQDGSPLGAALTVRDVTALRESEEHYRHMVELNPQVSWTADPDGGITEFNQRWLDLTGLTREEALGGGWALAPHPEDLPQMVAAWTHAVETGEAYDVEHRIRVADGSYRWMRSRALPRRDANGQIIRWYGTTEDIEARKQAERDRELMASRQRLFVREVLASMTEGRLRLVEMNADLPIPLNPTPVGPPILLTHENLRLLRRQVCAAAQSVHLPEERENDLETAIGEIAMNAVVHAGGGQGQVFADTTRGTVQVWVKDEGVGISEDMLHRATLEKGYSSAGTLGFGYWLVLRTVDRVYLLTGVTGTTVVLEQDQEPPPPRWYLNAQKLPSNG